MRGAILVTAAVLPLVGLVVAGRASALGRGTPVPKRPFELIHELPFFAALPIATLESIAVGLRERRYADLDEIVADGHQATRSS